MTFRTLRVVCLCAFLLGLQLTTISQAAHAELKLAVVDVEHILSATKAAKSIKAQVKKKRDSFLDEVKSEEEKLRKEQKSIESKRSEMTQEQLVAKAQEFEKRRLEARSKIQERKATLDKAYGVAMNKLTQAIFEVCQKIADQKGIDLVITRQNIIVGNMSLDITKEVVEQLDKTMPNISL